MLTHIIWDTNPEIFSILGREIRWYGLLFGLSFYLGYLLLDRILKKKGLSDSEIGKLAIYLIVGCILGLRLGHVFFYKPDYYLANPLEILKVWKGGLASHGAVFGIITAIIIYARKVKKSFFWLTDRIIIVILLIAPFIRTGNLMNSEIIGSQTNNAHAFMFVADVNNTLESRFAKQIEDISFEETGRDTTVQNTYYSELNLKIAFYKHRIDTTNIRKILHDYLIPNIELKEDLKQNIKVFKAKPKITMKENKRYFTAEMKIYGIPRHPAQIYEALSYLLMFILFFAFYQKQKGLIKEGFFLGMFLIFVFGARFFIEFLKEVQVPFENEIPLQMGQWLSIPFVLIGVFLVLWSQKKEAT